MKLAFNKYCLILPLILLTFTLAEAQETYATLTISNKSFPDASDGGSLIGSNVKIDGMSVYINESLFCFLTGNQLTSPNNIIKAVNIGISDPTLTVKLIVYYIHHEWNLGGTLHYLNLSKEFTVSSLFLNTQGVSETRTYNSFGGLDETISVNWSLDYKVEISPFKPEVKEIKVKKCFNLPFWVSMNHNTPELYDNSGSVYDWEYGLVTNDLVNNEDFQTYLQNIITDLYLPSQITEGIDFNNISSAIFNCSYDFMTDYLYLYGNLPSTRGSIAWMLLNGLRNQMGYSLSEAEINFLNSYFETAVLNQPDCIPPLLHDISVKNWTSLASGKDSSELIEFNPAIRLSVLTDKAKLSFRVKARNTLTGNSGPWSNAPEVDIMPSPPIAGIISSTLSCLNKPTSEITLDNITSPVGTDLFTYRILDVVKTCKSDTLDVLPIEFQGYKIVIKNHDPGSYKLCLTYQNTSINNCFADQPISIGSLPKLSFQTSTKDVSCPGGSDGNIRVKLSQWAGDFKILANGSTVNNISDYTFAGLPANSYEVKVNDFCYDDEPVAYTINQPETITLVSIIARTPTCISTPNGGFEVEASGISKDKYDYFVYKASDYPSGSPLISATSQGPIWVNYTLPGGSYIINVRDNEYPECPGAVSAVQVLQPVTPLDLRIDKVDKVKCFGGSTGEIDVSAAGGSEYYKFNIGSDIVVSNTAKFMSLQALTYTVLVRNSDENCSDVASNVVTVGTNPLLEINLTPKDANCFENNDGQINTVVTGGSGIYQSYSWEQKFYGSWFPHSSTTASPNNLFAGEYRIKVTDSEACFAYADATVNQPTLLSISSVLPHDIICYGTKGSINITSSGGNGGHSYFYSANWGASYTGFTSGAEFSEGTYLLKVKDSKGCEAIWRDYGDEEEVVITGPPEALDFSAVLSDFNGFSISGYGKSDGKITVDATGGNGEKGSGGDYDGYTYSLSGRSDQTNGIFTGLSAGDYLMKITDARGCSFSKSVTLTQPDILNLSAASIEHVKCFGSATGKITVSATGGAAPYTYQKNSSGFVSTPVFSGLIAGVYQIDVKDSNGNLKDLQVTVENKNEKISTILIPQDVLCFGESNGQITATTTGGSGSYNNVWQKFVGSTWQIRATGSSNINNLDPGKYRLITTDSDNCSVYDSTIISQPTLLSITAVVPHDIICFGTTGSIDISATGGKGGYQYFYSVNEGASYTQFTSGSPMSASSYKVKVKDSNSCETKWNSDVKITGPSTALDFTTILSDYSGLNISCYGRSDGSITINPTGGNGSGYNGYSYSFEGGASSQTSFYSNLLAGTYSVKVTDGRGCSVTKPVTLTQTLIPVGITVSNHTDTKCFNDASGAIILAASGGAQPYEYMIGQGSYVGSNEFAGLPKGNYSFTVRDKNGCTNTLSSVITNVYPQPAITLLPQDIKCYQKNDGSVQASISGGSGDFGLKWYIKSVDTWQYLKSDSSIITGLSPGDYRLQVTDKAGCPAIYDSTAVYQKVTPLVINRVTMRDIVCYGESGSIDIQASGSNGGYIYQYSRNNQSYENYLPGDPLPYASYKVRVKDVKGCITLWPEEQIITHPQKPLDLTWIAKDYNGSNVSCFGKSDGSLVVTPAGGNGLGYHGYSYILQGRPSQSDTLFENLAAGTYNINVTDGRGCVITRSVSLVQPSAPVKLEVSKLLDTKCFNDSSGVITLLATGGVQAYEYKIGQGSFVTTNEFGKLPTGNYNFTVRDKNGCPATVISSISNIYPKPAITLVPQDIRCYQKSDGVITSSLTGGSGNFGLKWYIKSVDTWQYLKSDSSIITGLSPGDYRLQVTDKAGCPAIYDSTVVYHKVTPLVINRVTMRDVVCYGDSGSIDIQASGSNGGYIYQYSRNNQSYENYLPGDPLPYASYKVRVKDVKGCITLWPDDQIITHPQKPLDLTWIAKDYNGSNVSCFGKSDGSVVVNPAGGNGSGYNGYSYMLQGGPAQSDTLFENLAAGTYNINVTDGRGCVITRSVSLVQPSAPVRLEVSKLADTKCFNDSSGVITLLATGGVQAYEYRIGEGSFVTTNEFGKLPSGNYQFAVRDKNGCPATVISSITNIYPKPAITLVPQDIRCYQKSDGQVLASISGGSGSFGLNWYKKSENTWQYLKSDSSIITGLSPGDYRLQVTDKAGCPAIFDSTAVYQKVTQLVIDRVTMRDVVCYGDSGSIDIQASGSNGGYIYQYSRNDQSYEDYLPGSPLPFASYKVRVKDLKGCITLWPDDQIITHPQKPLDLTWIAKDYSGYNVSCYGNNDGLLTVMSSGGNGSGYEGYSYFLSGRSVQTDTVFEKMKADNYTLKVTDGRGCTITREVILTQAKSELGLWSSEFKQATCINGADGMVSLVASGGSLPYTYSSGNEVFVPESEFTKLRVKNYRFTVKDANGCTQIFDTSIVNTVPEMKITGTISDAKCVGQNSGTIMASISGGQMPFAYKWEDDLSSDSYIEKLYKGSYLLSVTDGAGCLAEKLFEVSEPDLPLVIDYVKLKDIVCYGDSGSIDIRASGSNGGYTYQYSGNNQPFVNYLPGSPLPFNSYKLRVTDSKGCKTEWNENMAFTHPPHPLDLTWIAKDYNGSNVSCFGKSDGSLVVTPAGGNGSGYHDYSYILQGRPSQSDTLFENLAAGTYNINVTDGRGCVITRSVSLVQPSAPVKLEVSKLLDTKCFNDSSGVITLLATGGVQAYEYKIGQGSFVTTNEFGKLPTGNYNFTVRDKNGCPATVISSITNIYPKPAIKLVPEDIRCYQKSDGVITSSLTGGSGNFGLKWHIKSGDTWQYLKSDSSVITALSPGDYRLQVTDKAGCPAIYDSTTVYHKVTPLVINRVTMRDVVCYGDSGSIDIQASGSNGGYIYQYSRNNQSYENYLPGDPLPYASYKVRVKDIKGCITLWPDDQIITHPQNPLDLTWIAKDYNGSNVSCFGKSDGSVVVNPAGGNGSGYNGYSYMLQGGPAQSDTLFENLAAGTYNINVTDGRGCVITRSVSLVQPSAPVRLEVSKLVDTKCFNDSSGVITLLATGGVQVYEYRIGEGSFVTTNEFGKLPTGNYQFTVRDKNGCPGTVISSISNIYPKPAITLVPQDIRCYQKSDGQIQVSIIGGSGNFGLNWYKKSGNKWQYLRSDSSRITGLAPGDYRVQVTDKANCPSLYDSTTIYQKVTHLIVTATSQPACVQLPNGSIISVAAGGTPPYLYSVDQLKMQTDPSFQVYSGLHRVYSSDAFNCRAESTIQVGVRNTMPLVNFMVATNRYELDTLVIKDVSVPGPERVSWVFSPEAMVISSNNLETKVKYSIAGIYPVKMTGYFGTCEYSLEKLIKIAPFDPLVIPKDKFLKGIEKAQISPNPNSGQFKVKVKLYTKQQIQIKVLDYYSKIHFSARYPETIELEQEINIQGALPGTYVLWVIADNDYKALLFIISQ